MARKPARDKVAPADGSFFGGIAFWLALTLVLAVPLMWTSSTMDMFREPQGLLATTLWAVLAALFIAQNLGGAAWRDSWWLPLGGLLAAGVLSLVTSGETGRVLSNLVPVVAVGLGWGAVRQLDDRRRRWLWRVVIIAGVVQALLTLAFLAPSSQPEVYRLITRDTYERYSWIGTLGNPGYVGYFLVVPALLAAHAAIAQAARRLLYGGAAVLMAGVIVGTRTLTAMLALAAGAAVLAWHNAPRRYRWPALGAGAVVLALIAGAPPVFDRFKAAVDEVKQGGWVWLGSARLAGWASATGMLAARPLTGVGLGLFEANSFRFQDAEVLAQRGARLGLVTAFGETHNELLQFGAETGLVGVALLLAGALVAWRRRSRSSTGRAESHVVGAGTAVITAAGVVALTHFPFHLPTILAQWTIVAALLLPPLPSPPPLGRTAIVRYLAAALVIIAIGAIAWQRYSTSRALQQGIRVVQLLRAGQRDERTLAMARLALVRLEERSHWLPYSWRAEVALGNLAAEAREAGKAVLHFNRALALAERPEIRFNVGMAYLLAGDDAAAYPHLIKAVELNPRVFAEIKDARIAKELRRRLDVTGYGTRHPWIYDGTLAAEQ
jgi:tetratricopeptide (TPR) repeat protein